MDTRRDGDVYLVSAVAAGKALNSITDLGWSPEWAQHVDLFEIETQKIARIMTVDRGGAVVSNGDASWPIGLLPDDPIAVGDWAVLDDGTRPTRIMRLLPRSSALRRKTVGRKATAQLVAANIDTVLIVCAVGADLNPRRIERYVAAIVAGGSRPVVVVNKVDRDHDPLQALMLVEEAAPAVESHWVSALTGTGLPELREGLPEGSTVALVGSSGVGKSSLLNAFFGEERQDTGGIRQRDERGQHTTTRRELFRSPSGHIFIDTPGMKELGLWDAEGGIVAAFSDIEAWAEGCRFRDCRHADEPGCAVQQAIADGELTERRLANYLKLRAEDAYHQRRADAAAARAERDRWKSITKSSRARGKLNRRLGLKDW